ncbi:hypothetical protein BV20DRAFT_1111856 [Pilatotrama ljubarskyi]|nr:hypothetical protein BV20DRAFT_1111856 [Pilatotrama ljubarskyi]
MLSTMLSTMFSTLTFLALAFFSQYAYAVSSSLTNSPPTDIAAALPVVDIHALTPKANATLSAAGPSRIHADVFGESPTDFPATLMLCTTDLCISCFPLDMSTLPVGMCLSDSFNIKSVAIVQPSDAGLSFGVFVGAPGCLRFIQIPMVNTCFSTDNGTTMSDIAIN